ncbi:MAG: hypothetical protein QM784_26810 [Polyangiaceae bacterium]
MHADLRCAPIEDGHDASAFALRATASRLSTCPNRNTDDRKQRSSTQAEAVDEHELAGLVEHELAGLVEHELAGLVEHELAGLDDNDALVGVPSRCRRVAIDCRAKITRSPSPPRATLVGVPTTPEP